MENYNNGLTNTRRVERELVSRSAAKKMQAVIERSWLPPLGKSRTFACTPTSVQLSCRTTNQKRRSYLTRVWSSGMLSNNGYTRSFCFVRGMELHTSKYNTIGIRVAFLTTSLEDFNWTTIAAVIEWGMTELTSNNRQEMTTTSCSLCFLTPKGGGGGLPKGKFGNLWTEKKECLAG